MFEAPAIVTTTAIACKTCKVWLRASTRNAVIRTDSIENTKLSGRKILIYEKIVFNL